RPPATPRRRQSQSYGAAWRGHGRPGGESPPPIHRRFRLVGCRDSLAYSWWEARTGARSGRINGDDRFDPFAKDEIGLANLADRKFLLPRTGFSELTIPATVEFKLVARFQYLLQELSELIVVGLLVASSFKIGITKLNFGPTSA